MNARELRSLESPITTVAIDEVPPSLLERATAYNDAVTTFRDVVRGALADLQGGRAVDAESAQALRTAAADLVTAREYLLELARLPNRARRAR